MEGDMDNCSVRCLSSFEDLELLSNKSGVQLAHASQLSAVRHTLKRLGSYNVQKVAKKFVQLGELRWDEDKYFEVQAILDYVQEEGTDLYLIKWKGWTNEHNTWERKDNLSCENVIELYHKLSNANASRTTINTEMMAITGAVSITANQDTIECLSEKMVAANIFSARIVNVLHQVVSKRKAEELLSAPAKKLKTRLATNINLGNKKSKAYKTLKMEMDLVLKQWEKHMNDVDVNQARITVENKVDLDGPPDKFIYTNDYIEGPGITIPHDPFIGCDCDNCLDEKKACCGANAGSQFAYYKNKRVRVPSGTPIYECNKYCKCTSACPNRVVQHGRQYKVCLFKTTNGCGWGVKALQNIKKGSFVVEYVGEVITHEEAERRGKIYDGAGRTYLFDLDYNDDDCPYTVDAGRYGNISHFINHSCNPNLSVYGVWINTLDPRLPRIALFANRDIRREEELTFDYMMTADITSGFALRAAPLISTGDTKIIPEVDTNKEVTEENIEIPDPVEDQITIDHATIVPVDSKSTKHETVKSAAEEDASVLVMPPTPPPSEIQESVPSKLSLPTSPSPATKYRVVCQCGASNCRGFLY